MNEGEIYSSILSLIFLGLFFFDGFFIFPVPVHNICYLEPLNGFLELIAV